METLSSQQSCNIVTLLEMITILPLVVFMMITGTYIFCKSCRYQVLCLLYVVSFNVHDNKKFYYYLYFIDEEIETQKVR